MGKNNKPYTNESFDKKLKIVNPNIRRLGDYKTTKIPIEFECLIDEHKWEAYPNNMLKGGQPCLKCSGNTSTSKLSNDIIDRRISSKTIIRIGNYVNLRTKIDVQCIICKDIFSVNPNSIEEIKDCKNCKKNNVIELLKNRKIIVKDFVNTSSLTNFQCAECNHSWTTTLASVLGGCGCANCKGTLKLTNEVVDKRLEGRQIIRLEDYINAKTSIKWKCLLDNYEWSAFPDDLFSKNQGCPMCGENAPLTNDIVDERLEGRNIIRLGNYINAKIKVDFQCLICNTIWDSLPNNIFQNQGCPECATGKSERRLEELIKQYVKYDNCKHHKYLCIYGRTRFPDYYLEIGDKIVVIERQGHQHYQPIRFGGMSQKQAEINFFHQIIRDNDMRWYCDANNIKLVEIPYWLEEDEITEELKVL
jgi:hypothetical protein